VGVADLTCARSAVRHLVSFVHPVDQLRWFGHVSGLAVLGFSTLLSYSSRRKLLPGVGSRHPNYGGVGPRRGWDACRPIPTAMTGVRFSREPGAAASVMRRRRHGRSRSSNTHKEDQAKSHHISPMTEKNGSITPCDHRDFPNPLWPHHFHHLPREEVTRYCQKKAQIFRRVQQPNRCDSVLIAAASVRHDIIFSHRDLCSWSILSPKPQSVP
ncbi:hypothetical protein BHM03_00056567, partial [Ensete ventricosum]